jgi:addiction module HigA family antidote
MARTPIHPGEVLKDELDELGMSARTLASILGVPANRMYQVLASKRSLTADTALRLARYFGTAPAFWMNLQSAYELDVARQEIGADLNRIPRRKPQPVPEAQV